MRKVVVFCRKKGTLGVRRLANKDEENKFKTNYVVDILDPVSFEQLETVKGFSDPEHDWHELKSRDPRAQFYHLFRVIEEGDADWVHEIQGSGEDATVEYSYIENRHEVFELIRKIFTPKS